MKKENFWRPRTWISVVGFVLAIGVLMNILASYIVGIRLVEWKFLITNILMVSAISGGREVTISILKKKSVSVTTPTPPETPKSFKRKLKRVWIPIIGYMLSIGYATNCIVVPLVACVKVVDPIALTILSIGMMAINTGKDISLSVFGVDMKIKKGAE